MMLTWWDLFDQFPMRLHGKGSEDRQETRQTPAERNLYMHKNREKKIEETEEMINEMRKS